MLFNLNPVRIDNEVCKYLNMLESMESDQIITKEERAKLRTKVKAWAYDRLQEWEEFSPKSSVPTE